MTFYITYIKYIQLIGTTKFLLNFLLVVTKNMTSSSTYITFTGFNPGNLNDKTRTNYTVVEMNVAVEKQRKKWATIQKPEDLFFSCKLMSFLTFTGNY